MKGTARIILTLACVWLLQGCSAASEGVEHKYKQEQVLMIDIRMPETVETDQSQTFQVLLSDHGRQAVEADYVRFAVWGKDESKPEQLMDAVKEGNGVYSIKRKFDEEGIYYLQVYAAANGSEVMPTRRFAVGDVAVEAEEEQDEADHGHSGGAHH